MSSHRTRKWIVLSAIVTLLIVLFISVPKKVKDGAIHIAIGYTDTALCDSALAIVQKDSRIKEMLGDLQPLHKMAILEGYVKYSTNLDSVFMVVSIKGNKGKGKMDIYAYKNNNAWEYEKLDVRLNVPKFVKQTIPIITTPN